MGEVKVSAKSSEFTKQATIWMRPDVYRTLRVMAAQRDTTIQSLIDQMVRREAKRAVPESSDN